LRAVIHFDITKRRGCIVVELSCALRVARCALWTVRCVVDGVVWMWLQMHSNCNDAVPIFTGQRMQMLARRRLGSETKRRSRQNCEG